MGMSMKESFQWTCSFTNRLPRTSLPSPRCMHVERGKEVAVSQVHEDVHVEVRCG